MSDIEPDNNSFTTFYNENSDESVYVELISDAIYMVYPEYLESITEDLNNNNIDSLKKNAHSLKGSSASLGMKNMSIVAAKLHKYDYENKKKAEKDLQTLKLYYQEIKELFEILNSK